MSQHVFVVARDHEAFYAYLLERFAGDTKVAVVLDRRVWDRRRRTGAEGYERRHADRRQFHIGEELRTRAYAMVSTGMSTGGYATGL